MLPLQDIRIISLEQYGAGPYGSLHLADLGAEVIKIEDPSTGGEVGRHIPPYARGDDSLFFQTFNRNKRSLQLDLHRDDHRGVFEDLVRVSDVVFSNLRGDVPARLGITHAQLAPLNPRIVCCALSGFGATGPRAAEPAYDYLVQGLTGWMSLTGEPGGPPTKTGLSVVDFAGGLVAAATILAGVHAARRDGLGMDCDVSLFETALSMLTYLGTWQLNADHEPVRTAHSAHPSLVPFQNFPTADGWIVIACAKEKFWQRLATALGHPEWAVDARFATFADRHRHAPTLITAIEEVLQTRTSRAWLEILGDAGVPCAPVNTVAEALADPQTLAREAIVTLEHPHWGELRQIASPVRVGTPRTEHRRAPGPNQDADHVLREILQYSQTQISAVLS